jgi:hypothetical protein
VLEGYCANYSLARQYQAVAEAEPMSRFPVYTKGGGIEHVTKPNPAAAEARKHWSLVKQFAAEFGLTPSARTRVGSRRGRRTEAAGKDPAEAFLFGNGRPGPRSEGGSPEEGRWRRRRLRRSTSGVARLASTSAWRSSGTTGPRALASSPGGHPRGLWFDVEAGERVIEFVEEYCKHYEGEWAGQPIVLEEWQKRLIRILFGWSGRTERADSGPRTSRSRARTGSRSCARRSRCTC